MTKSPPTVSVTVTIVGPPVFYTPEYWKTHTFDSIDVSAPWAVKPKIDLEAALDDRLGDVIDRAADRFGLVPGEEAVDLAGETRASACTGCIGFYTDADATGFGESTISAWPSTLPVADDDGTVSQVPWEHVTYRDLLTSSEAGLIAGDVLRPYLVPFVPQRDVPSTKGNGKVRKGRADNTQPAPDPAKGTKKHKKRSKKKGKKKHKKDG